MKRLVFILFGLVVLVFAAPAGAIYNTHYPCPVNGQVVPIARDSTGRIVAEYYCAGHEWWVIP